MTTPSSGYRIGKVSRITGITADTLRIWERRYAVVVPVRTQAGGRLYAADDIARLKLIKKLVDDGDSISNLAALSHQQLQMRLAESRAMTPVESPVAPLRLAVVGPSLSTRLNQSHDQLEGLQIQASYRNIQMLRGDNRPLEFDLLVIEQSTLQAETAKQIVDLINEVNAMHAIIIYRFSARDVLNKLPRDKCSAVHAPIDLAQLRKTCLSFLHVQTDQSPHASFDSSSGDEIQHAPPRRFDDEALARIASLSPAIKCECPHHLAELLSSLAAFEKYSSECENRNQRDAEVHSTLSRTTSHARHMIEDALEMVLEIENIEL